MARGPWRLRALLAAGGLLAAAATACGAPAPAAEPTPRPTATVAPPPALQQPASTGTPATAEATPRWRTDLAAGGRVGNAAPNATVTLPDGTMPTLEELAGGKPLLLYFFATW